MSMREYSINEYGLMLTQETMKQLAKELVKDFSEEEYNEECWEFDDLVSEKIGAEYLSNFSGDIILLADNGGDDWYNVDNFTDDVVHFVPLKNYPTLFKKAYENVEEIVSEMKYRVGKYLPEDFDYRNNLRHICGTCYG